MKYVPYSLFLAFGIKALVCGMTWELAAAIGITGITCFLIEKGIESSQLALLRKEAASNAAVIAQLQIDTQQTKAYVTSMKLNGMRNGYRAAGE